LGVDKTFSVWDTTTGELIGQPLSHSVLIANPPVFAVSPDGTHVVIGQKYWSDQPNTAAAAVWDIVRREEVAKLQHDGSLTSAAYSSDGRQIVTASADQTARVWDAATGNPIGLPLRIDRTAEQGDLGGIRSANFSRDGSQIIGCAGTDIHLWQTPRTTPEFVLFNSPERAVKCAISNDGSLLVTIGSGNTAHVWDIFQRKRVGPSFRLEPDMVPIMISDDNQRVLVAQGQHSGRFWDIATGTFVGHSIAMNVRFAVNTLNYGDPIVLSLDGRWLATKKPTLQVWNCELGEMAWSQPVKAPRMFKGREIPHSGRSLAFSPDGRKIVSDEDHAARIYETATGKAIGATLTHDSRIQKAVFDSTGSKIVTASYDHTAQIWDAATGNPLGPRLQHGAFVTYAAFSPDGCRIVTACYDKTIRVWDAGTSQLVCEPIRAEVATHYVSFSPDGLRILGSHNDGSFRVWDAATGTPLGTPIKHVSRGEERATFSPDGTKIAILSSQVAIYDAPLLPPSASDAQKVFSLWTRLAPDDRGQIVELPYDEWLKLWKRPNH
jgi:WD40 repeat protein